MNEIKEDIKMKKQITIKTHLHEGIYKSCGGGETREVASFNIGPRNLLIATKELQEKISSNQRSYGSIGMGRSWLEIDGVEILSDELPENKKEAADLINDVLSGEIHKTRKYIADAYEEERKQWQKQFDDEMMYLQNNE
jgi:hypothetical protein